MKIAKVIWWLDAASLPERYVWARLSDRGVDGAEILDCENVTHKFANVVDARSWLLEDEYETLESLREKGAVPFDLLPPEALNV